MDPAALIRLLHLSSPGLPVGAYSYSQGLETALASGLVSSPAEVEAWISDHLILALGRNDLPYGWRMLRAWTASDLAAVSRWNEEYLTSRDGAEPRAETIQMGFSLSQLLSTLEGERAAPLFALQPPSFLAAFTFASHLWELPPREALTAFLWAWLETQILAYLKTGRIGQAEGQRILVRLGQRVPAAVEGAEALPDDELNTFTPGLALAGFAHEIQDERMFRS